MKDRWKKGIRLLRKALYEQAEVLGLNLVLKDAEDSADHAVYLYTVNLDLVKESVRRAAYLNQDEHYAHHKANAKVKRVIRRFLYDLL